MKLAEKEKREGDREREQFGRKQRKTTGAAGGELLNSADYQNKLCPHYDLGFIYKSDGYRCTTKPSNSNVGLNNTKVLLDFSCTKYHVRQYIQKHPGQLMLFSVLVSSFLTAAGYLAPWRFPQSLHIDDVRNTQDQFRIMSFFSFMSFFCKVMLS